MEVDPAAPILDALIRVKAEQDGSLSFRHSCGHGVCGSDAMVISGKERLACKTLVRDVAEGDGAVVTIAPLKHLPVQRDLMVDQQRFFESYRAVKPFLINDEAPGREGTDPDAAGAGRLRGCHQLHPLRRLLFRLPGVREECVVSRPCRPAERSPVHRSTTGTRGSASGCRCWTPPAVCGAARTISTAPGSVPARSR